MAARVGPVEHWGLQGSVSTPFDVEPRTSATDVSPTASAEEGVRWASLLSMYPAARKRALASYDADVLAYFVQLVSVEEEYAAKLQALDARLAKPQADMPSSSPDEGGGLVAAWAEYVAPRGPAELTRCVQYATLTQAWGAATCGVHAQSAARAEGARRLGATVVAPLRAAVREAAARRADALRAADLALHEAQAARQAASAAADAFGAQLWLFRRTAAAEGPLAPQAGPLRAAACECAAKVGEANRLTAHFERRVAPAALDSLQSNEEARRAAVGAALQAFGALASEGAAPLPAAAASLAANASEAVGEADAVQDDLDTFVAASLAAAAAAGGGTAELLVSPPFAESLAELGPPAAGDDGHAAGGSGGGVAGVLATHRLASSVLGGLWTLQAWAAAGAAAAGAQLSAGGLEAARPYIEQLFGGAHAPAAAEAAAVAAAGALPSDAAAALQGMTLDALLEDDADADDRVAVVTEAHEQAAAAAAEPEEDDEAATEYSWFYVDEGGATLGPLAWSELVRAAREGALLPSGLTRHGKQAAWVPAESVPALIVPSLPPPPPPPPPPPLPSPPPSS